MAKRVARRRAATPAEAERVRAAIAEERRHAEATISQARQMRDAAKLSRKVIAQLKAAREQQGLSLNDLKNRTGMSREAISRLENLEEPNPQVATLVRLASAIGVQLDVSVTAPPS